MNPHFTVGGICFQTYPCQHNVTITKTNVTKRMSGTNIYKLYKSHNLPLSGHFLIYKDRVAWDEIKVKDSEEIKSHYLLNVPEYLSRFLIAAVLSQNTNMVKYLVEERKALVDRSIIIESCKTTNSDMFKYLSNKCEISLTKKGADYVAHGGKTILSIACYHGNIDLVKYLVEEKKVLVTSRALSESLKQDVILKYMINKCVEQKVMYNGDIHILSKDTHDLLLQNNLIYNPTSECNIIFNCNSVDDGEKLFLQEFVKNNINLINVCKTQLSTHNISLPHFTSDVKRMELRFSSNVMKNVTLTLNSVEIPFVKNGNNFILEFKEPLHTYCLVFTSIYLRFEFLECKELIKKLDFSVDFVPFHKCDGDDDKECTDHNTKRNLVGNRYMTTQYGTIFEE